ncbi:hypothetical protein PVMG_02539 [Plasmodium vivax Mauritania I]|uniref:Variable surface protein Vir4 n=1 Tax=Plasmodium vivax Mauritania I TaxID=1035515 RepID=A0A0J9TGH5_PLAVI|nr:hypothetical protein PVMG_02539 [Plasmodium vivax Mauritania I]
MTYLTDAFALSGELNSDKFYKHLDQLNISDEYNSYCDPLHTLGRRGRYVKKICKQTLSYLKTKYSKPDNQNDKYDVCNLLNYWVYSRLDMTYAFKNDFNVFQAHGNLIQKWYDFIDHKLNRTNPNICKPIPNIPAQPDWKERKELLNYCVDVDELRSIANTFPLECNKYYRYIKSKTELYKQYERVCASGNKDKCPDFFKTCEVYDPEKVLRTLKCHTEMEGTKAAASEKAITEDGENPEQPVSVALSVGNPHLNGKPQSVENVGHIFLGVVATTMTSGALYRVNLNSLIQINCISLLISFITYL